MDKGVIKIAYEKIETGSYERAPTGFFWLSSGLGKGKKITSYEHDHFLSALSALTAGEADLSMVFLERCVLHPNREMVLSIEQLYRKAQPLVVYQYLYEEKKRVRVVGEHFQHLSFLPPKTVQKKESYEKAPYAHYLVVAWREEISGYSREFREGQKWMTLLGIECPSFEDIAGVANAFKKYECKLTVLTSTGNDACCSSQNLIFACARGHVTGSSVKSVAGDLRRKGFTVSSLGTFPEHPSREKAKAAATMPSV